MSQLDEIRNYILWCEETQVQREIIEDLGLNKASYWKLKNKKLPESSRVVQRVHALIQEIEHGEVTVVADDEDEDETPQQVDAEATMTFGKLGEHLADHAQAGTWVALLNLVEEIATGHRSIDISITFRVKGATDGSGSAGSSD